MQGVKPVLNQLPARFWKRVVAYLLDMLLISLVVITPFKNKLEQYTDYSSFSTKPFDSSLAVITFIIVTLTLFYFTFLEYKTGQTLGKILLRLHVVSKQRALTLKQAFIRNLTKPFTLVLFIDTLYLFFSRGTQRLFEKFSNTEVVELTWQPK